MSKSLGNLYTLKDLEEKGHTAMEVRYVLISGHYRKQLNFTLDSLSAAHEALGKLAKGAAKLAGNIGSEEVALDAADFGPFQAAWDSLNSDLNTPAAIGHLFTGLKQSASLEGKEAAAALAGFNRVLRALGLTLPEEESADIPADIAELAAKRWQARQDKDWAASDALRDELKDKGWVMKDGKDDYTVEPA